MNYKLDLPLLKTQMIFTSSEKYEFDTVKRRMVIITFIPVDVFL